MKREDLKRFTDHQARAQASTRISPLNLQAFQGWSSELSYVSLPVLSGTLDLHLPASWQVQVIGVRPAPPLPPEVLRQAFDSPIDSPALNELAAGKRRVTIVVEDTMRATPVAGALAELTNRLLAAGVPESGICLMLATAAHRAQTGQAVRDKLGPGIVRRFPVIPHNPYDNLVRLGTSPRGIPVWINRRVAESDLLIAVGGVVPHGGAGFGGGAKLVMPGVCGIETIIAHHEGLPRGGYSLSGNAWRDEIEAIATMAGLALTVNIVVNGRGQAAGIFVGDPLRSHRQAAALASSLYQVPLPPADSVDLAIVSGYPLDRELGQMRKALLTACQCVRDGGAIVLAGECPEGAGFHGLYGAGGRFQHSALQAYEKRLSQRRVWVCSPNLDEPAAWQLLPASTRVLHDPATLSAELAQAFPHARACVLLQGTLLFL